MPDHPVTRDKEHNSYTDYKMPFTPIQEKSNENICWKQKEIEKLKGQCFFEYTEGDMKHKVQE